MRAMTLALITSGGLLLGMWLAHESDRRVLPSLPAIVLQSAEPSATGEATMTVQLQQQWQLQPGEQLAGHPVVSSLGDVSFNLKGTQVRVPFQGTVTASSDSTGCIFFESAEVPAYLFRLCGVNRPVLGEVEPGKAIGSAEILAIAVLRKQPDGNWAMVEPSVGVLEQWLQWGR